MSLNYIIQVLTLNTFLKVTMSVEMDQMEYIAKRFSQEIAQKLQFETKYENIEAEYSRLYNEGVVEIDKIQVQDVSQEFAENLKTLLRKKKDALLNIKNKAEELYGNYRYDPNIMPFNYSNRRFDNPVREEKLFYIGAEVNINRSYVQTPTNIFHHHVDILNAANWSEPLDDVFKANYRDQPDLLWQYFGSETGMFRSFPGKNTKSQYSFYDARRRLWYNEAINSGKDVIIAVDLSGSIVGTPFKIVKLAIKSLIDTLQQNDFFNVVYHRDKKTSELVDCFDKLVQATQNNKQLFSKQADKLQKPYGEADVHELLKRSLAILDSSDGDDLTSANCNKVIMLISDGMEEDSKITNLFDSYSHLDVVVFTYFIGFGFDTECLTELAKEHGGAMYSFPTVGSVWNEVLKYQQVLNEPLAKDVVANVIYTPLYNDYSPDGNGLGLMITIAVCVFSNNSGSTALIGVAGIDVRLKVLEQQYPKHKLGVWGHAFVINNNGVILIHPYLRDTSKQMDDLSTVYLEDLEDSKVVLEVKKAMIKKEKGCLNSSQSLVYPDSTRARIIILNTTYCFDSINGTPYSSGICVPLLSQYELKPRKSVDLSLFQKTGLMGININNSKNIETEIASWLFCDFPSIKQLSNPASERFYPTANELKEYIEKSKNFNKCNVQLLRKLLFSSSVVYNHTSNFWNSEDTTNVTSKYIITKSGIISTQGRKVKNFDRDIFREELLLHAESLNNINFTFSVSVQMFPKADKSGANDKAPSIAITKSIKLAEEKFTEGIIGIYVESTFLTKMISEFSSEYNCSECQKFNCSDIVNTSCFLVDENGYVVASNHGNQRVGMFLGLVNGHVLEKLRDNKIYETVYYNDTQGLCNETDISSDSHSEKLRPFFVNFVKAFTELVNSVMTIVFLCYQYIVLPVTTQEPFHKELKICTKKTTFYQRNHQHSSYFSNISYFEDCQQKFGLISVNNTNLDLLVVKKDTKSKCDSHYIIRNEPVQSTEWDTCSQGEKFRKTMPLCYQKLPEDTSNSYRNSPMIMTILFPIFILDFFC